MKETDKWLSYHIFCHNLLHHDRIICKLNKWTYEKHLYPYFFIRYWEGGPHIRFRIKRKDTIRDDYYNTLVDLLESELSDESIILTKEEYYQGHKLDGEKIPIEELPWYENNTIVPITYVRENERYGGKEAIEHAEYVFYRSSQLVSAMLEGCMNCHMMIRMLFYVHIYEKVNAAIKECGINFDFPQFYANCFSYWNELYDLKDAEYIRDIANAIKHSFEDKEEKINTVFSFIQPQIQNNFIDSLVEYLKNVSQLKGNKMMRSVLFSQMHMFANRLGIPIEYECAIYSYYNQKNTNLTCQKGA